MSVYLLSKNPTADDLLAAELDSVLGGCAPRFADLSQLRYMEKVVKEAMPRESKPEAAKCVL